ncbi:MAG: hypothetical protein PWP37_1285, partial [Thermotogota bacterium]|nr:hypothetical protein [Thermotogota bacterium]
ASRKLKQDVESFWKRSFVSACEEISGAQLRKLHAGTHFTFFLERSLVSACEEESEAQL